MAEKNANTWLDTPDPQVFIKNSARFNDLMMMYRCTVREVRTKLEVLNDEFSVEYKRNPIAFIKTRIKKPETKNSREEGRIRMRKNHEFPVRTETHTPTHRTLKISIYFVYL